MENKRRSHRIADLLRQFERIAARLSLTELQRIGDAEQSWNMEEMLEQLEVDNGSVFLHGTYSENGVRYALREYGFGKKLAKRGFQDVDVAFELDDPYQPALKIYGVRDKRDQAERYLLVELVSHETFITPRESCPCPRELVDQSFPSLFIDWIRLQDPTRSFDRRRPRLPGQEHPGLGLGAEVLGLIAVMARRLGKTCLITKPERYHNAFMYRQMFRFIDPYDEGVMRAIARHTAPFSLAEVAWGIEEGYLMDTSTGRAFSWKSHELVLPLEKGLQHYVDSPEYEAEAERVSHDLHFSPRWVSGQFDSQMIP